MRPHLEDGTVGSVLELLTGIAALASRDQELRVFLVGANTTVSVRADATGIAAAVEQAARERSLTTGFTAPEVAADGLDYLITDAVPSASSERPGRRIALLAAPDVGRWYAARTSLPVTVIHPATAGGLRAELLADSHRLASLVSALLARG
jgi:predicted ribonuclease YlaK